MTLPHQPTVRFAPRSAASPARTSALADRELAIVLPFPAASTRCEGPPEGERATVWIRGYRGKRTFDLVVGCLLFVLLAPVMVTIATGLCLTSGGPWLESLRRRGQTGEEIRLLRFCSRPSASPPAVAEDVRTIRMFEHSRPLETSLGRGLRRTGLERLPELWAVLKGDLSLVGPPAALPDQSPETQGSARRAWSLKPGLVSPLTLDHGTNDDSRATMQYVARQGVWTDLKILAKALVRRCVVSS